MRRNGPPFDLAALPSAIALIFFVLLLTIPALSALLVDQNDTSAENTRIVTNLLSEGRTDDLNQEISATTDAPQEESNQTFLSGPFHQLTKEQWEQLTTPPNDQPLITEIPFKIAGRPSPRYAFITSNSYNQYLDHLNTLCRKTEDDDIAEIRLNSLDNDYFTWEEMAFNRAVIKRIFPETEQGDHSRYLNATRKLRKMHLRAEPESQCKTEKNEDTWSARVDERSQFEDFIINTVLDISKMEELQKRRLRKTGKKFGWKAANSTNGNLPLLMGEKDEKMGGSNETSAVNSTNLLPADGLAEWPFGLD